MPSSKFYKLKKTVVGQKSSFMTVRESRGGSLTFKDTEWMDRQGTILCLI